MINDANRPTSPSEWRRCTSVCYCRTHPHSLIGDSLRHKMLWLANTCYIWYLAWFEIRHQSCLRVHDRQLWYLLSTTGFSVQFFKLFKRALTPIRLWGCVRHSDGGVGRLPPLIIISCCIAVVCSCICVRVCGCACGCGLRCLVFGLLVS